MKRLWQREQIMNSICNSNSHVNSSKENRNPNCLPTSNKVKKLGNLKQIQFTAEKSNTTKFISENTKSHKKRKSIIEGEIKAQKDKLNQRILLKRNSMSEKNLSKVL